MELLEILSWSFKSVSIFQLLKEDEHLLALPQTLHVNFDTICFILWPHVHMGYITSLQSQ